MKIWAHTVFQNEERWLWYSVTSVIDYVDKLLLWDTGSTDKSWEIAKLLKNKYGDKIELRQYGSVTPEEFPIVRQEMLDATIADWFIVVDGDEIWWDESISKVISKINEVGDETETIVVPNYNVVGDIFHYFDNKLGRYQFGNLKGNYAMRAVKRTIKGLHSEGRHGVWGWADKDNKQIQERKTFEFVNAPYIHTTFLPRGESREDDIKVPKRAKKLKHEIGISFPKDFYYPESLFKEKPNFIKSPWETPSLSYKFVSTIMTPLKNFRRKYLMKGAKHGY